MADLNPISGGVSFEDALNRVSRRQLLARARDLAAPSYRGDPNWSFAQDLFGLSSFHAKFLCERLGVDPDGYEVLPDPDSLYRDPEPAPALIAQAEQGASHG